MVSTHSRPKTAGQANRAKFAFNAWFQHTAARRRLERKAEACFEYAEFQHTAARRRLGCPRRRPRMRAGFNTQPPEDGWEIHGETLKAVEVSTHSRPKTAGKPYKTVNAALYVSTHSRPKTAGTLFFDSAMTSPVSTHSRPKTAGGAADGFFYSGDVSTHSRPKTAGTHPFLRNVL